MGVESINGMKSGTSYRIREHHSCTSRSVVYFIFCRKCLVQGVGETSNPRTRLPQYLKDIMEGHYDQGPGVCSISRHFGDGQHSLADIEFTIVDKVSALASFQPAVIGPMRL